ncbi:flagellar hook-length control protein FliK [Vibrio ostreicida]|uniref:flagellar hook-length control protein FliK n=1 Tax=Vibrio ostreicida TaxID=526588 RepID=UPI003B5B3CA6
MNSASLQATPNPSASRQGDSDSKIFQARTLDHSEKPLGGFTLAPPKSLRHLETQDSAQTSSEHSETDGAIVSALAADTSLASQANKLLFDLNNSARQNTGPMQGELFTNTQFNPLRSASAQNESSRLSMSINEVKTPVLATASTASKLSSSLVAETSSIQTPSLQSVLQTLSTNGQSAPPQNQPPTLATAPTHGTEWAAVKVDTQAGKWGEQMMQVLHDRVSFQAQQHVQEAKIRLDPPELGKLDLLVRVEGDRLSVQINANATATREALMQVSERLRAELQEQNFVHVDVNVGSGDKQSESMPQSHEAQGTILDSRELMAADHSAPPSEHWLSTQA